MGKNPEESVPHPAKDLAKLLSKLSPLEIEGWLTAMKGTHARETFERLKSVIGWDTIDLYDVLFASLVLEDIPTIEEFILLIRKRLTHGIVTGEVTEKDMGPVLKKLKLQKA